MGNYGINLVYKGNRLTSICVLDYMVTSCMSILHLFDIYHSKFSLSRGKA